MDTLLAQFKDYAEVLIEAANDRVAAECKILLGVIVELSQTADAFTQGKTPADIFMKTNQFEVFHAKLHRVYTEFLKPTLQLDEMFDSNMSSAYRITASETLTRLRVVYEKYLGKIAAMRAENLRAAIPVFMEVDVDIVHGLYKKYPPTYKLYAGIMQAKLLVADDATAVRIGNHLQKDLAEIFPRPVGKLDAKLHLTNPPLVTLQPVTSTMTIEQLTASVFQTELRIDMWTRDIQEEMLAKQASFSDRHGHDRHGHDRHSHDRHGHDRHSHDRHNRDRHGHNRSQSPRSQSPRSQSRSGPYGSAESTDRSGSKLEAKLEAKLESKQEFNKYWLGGASTAIFKTLASTHKCCVVIAHHVTHHPVVHDIRKLIIRKEASKLIQSREAGVTASMVKRFQTITQEEPADWNFQYEIFNANAAHTVIIETLDDETFRILAPGGYIGSAILPSDVVSPYLQYIQNNITVSESAGRHQYCCSKSVTKMFLEREIDIEELFAQAAEPTHTIVRELIAAVKKCVGGLIDGRKLTSDAEVMRILHNPIIEEAVLDTILRGYDWNTDSDFQPHELMASFMADLLIIGKRFTRELHDGYTKNPPKDFAEINALIDQIITRAVELLLPDDTNIYQALRKKQLMLGAGLGVEADVEQR